PSIMDVLLSHATEAPRPFPRPAEIYTVPPAVEEVVLGCLAKEPAKRPSCARKLADQFLLALAQEEAAPTESNGAADQPLAEETTQAVNGTDAGSDERGGVYRFEAWMPESVA